MAMPPNCGNLRGGGVHGFGLDVKHIMQTMVRATPYRNVSKALAAVLEKDPENRCRGGARFVTREMFAIRDRRLWTVGAKSTDLRLQPYRLRGLAGTVRRPGLPADYRRGLVSAKHLQYCVARWRRPRMMNFRFAEPRGGGPGRTHQPHRLQALNLMNDPVDLEAGAKLAERTGARWRGCGRAMVLGGVRGGGADRASRRASHEIREQYRRITSGRRST